MSSAQRVRAGIALVIVWVCITAGKDVYLGYVVQGVDPAQVLLVCIGLAAAFFSVMHLRSGVRLRSAGGSTLRDIVLLNIFTVGGWGGVYLALEFLEPAVYESFSLGLEPVGVVLMAPLLRAHAPMSRTDKIALFAMLVTSLSLGVIVAAGHSSLGVISSSRMAAGFACMAVVGVSSGGIILVSKRLSDAGLSATSIMASRFWLLLAIAGAVFAMQRAPLQPLYDHLPGVLTLGVLGAIVSMYALQKAIQLTEPSTVVLISCLLPVMTVVLQLVDHRFVFSAPVLINAVVTSAIVVWSTHKTLTQLHAGD